MLLCVNDAFYNKGKTQAIIKAKNILQGFFFLRKCNTYNKR